MTLIMSLVAGRLWLGPGGVRPPERTPALRLGGLFRHPDDRDERCRAGSGAQGLVSPSPRPRAAPETDSNPRYFAFHKLPVTGMWVGSGFEHGHPDPQSICGCQMHVGYDIMSFGLNPQPSPWALSGNLGVRCFRRPTRLHLFL